MSTGLNWKDKASSCCCHSSKHSLLCKHHLELWQQIISPEDGWQANFNEIHLPSGSTQGASHTPPVGSVTPVRLSVIWIPKNRLNLSFTNHFGINCNMAKSGKSKVNPFQLSMKPKCIFSCRKWYNRVQNKKSILVTAAFTAMLRFKNSNNQPKWRLTKCVYSFKIRHENITTTTT